MATGAAVHSDLTSGRFSGRSSWQTGRAPVKDASVEDTGFGVELDDSDLGQEVVEASLVPSPVGTLSRHRRGAVETGLPRQKSGAERLRSTVMYPSGLCSRYPPARLLSGRRLTIMNRRERGRMAHSRRLREEGCHPFIRFPSWTSPVRPRSPVPSEASERFGGFCRSRSVQRNKGARASAGLVSRAGCV